MSVIRAIGVSAILALVFSSILSSTSSSASDSLDNIRIGFLVSSNQGKDKQLLDSYKSSASEAINKTEEWINGRTFRGQQEGRSFPKLVHKNISVLTAWVDPGNCDEKTALGQTVVLHRSNADVFIGPFCQQSLKVVTLLGSFWNTSVVTWAPYLSTSSPNKADEKVISLFGALEDFVKAVHVVLLQLKWNKIAIIYEKDHDLCSLLVEDAMRQNLYYDHDNTVVDVLTVSRANITAMDDSLERIKKTTRTTVLCMTHRTLQEFMIKADSMDMTSGYYGFMYVNFDPSPFNLKLQSSKKTGESSIKNLDKVFVQFGQFPQLKHVEEIDDPITAINESRSASEINDELEMMERFQLKPYFHDAVAYAIILARHRHTNIPDPNGVNASFLKTGPIHLDEKGMRKSEFSLVHHRDGNMVVVTKVTDTLDLITMDAMAFLKHRLPISAFDCHSPYASCTSSSESIAGIVSAVVLTVAILIIAIVVYKKYWKSKCVSETEWVVDDSEVLRKKLKMCAGNAFSNGTASPGNQKKKLVRMETRMTLGLGSLSSLDKNMLYAPVANYRGMVVAVKHVRWTHTQLLKRDMLQDLKTLKEISHDYLNQFIGAHVSHIPGDSYVLFRYCSKGSLQDVLENDDIKLDWMFKLSFTLDLARGMEHLHKSPLRSHGNLKSSNCVIDSRWVLKVTDFGAVTSFKKPGKDPDVDEREFNNSLLWTAPELLRMPKRSHKGTQKGDIYSFGIIMQEILLRSGPFFHNNMEPDDILTLVKNDRSRRPYRPVIPPGHDNPHKAVQLMVSCWAEYPDARPDFHNICKKLLAFNGAKRFNILDNMLSLLESYSSNLEQLVAERTEELEAEKRKTDSLLYQMLPPSVAEQLKGGQHVIPESFENVSIFFSDIVGFTSMASESKPLEVVDVLNDLYTCFDDIIARRDVYKVETIGDAYMVVSGCPMRNGERHAGEIAIMALDLVSAVSSFKIRHRPNDKLNLRVGLHVGPCAAGVVGRTMPRYCLFGDTVNMTSRMESTGKALHIHMSNKMNETLVDLNWGFITVDRGFIDVKGKGLQKTFWLVGKEGYSQPLPEAMLSLQKNSADIRKSPAPSVCSLNVEDSMFSALRKTSITYSSIMLDNDPTKLETPEARDTLFKKSNKRVDISSPTARKKTLKRRFATAQTPTFSDDTIIVNSDDFVVKDVNNTNTTGSGNGMDNKGGSNINTPYKKDSACYSMSDHNSEPDLSKVEDHYTVQSSQRQTSSHTLLPRNNSNSKQSSIHSMNNQSPNGKCVRCISKTISNCGSGCVENENQNVHFSTISGTKANDLLSRNVQQSESLHTKTDSHTNYDKNNSSSTSIQQNNSNDGIPRIEIS